MSWIGRPLRRREDAPLLAGRRRFVDDLRVPDLAHLVLVRSPHAHARVTRLDIGRARKTPGVVAVVTAADLDTTAPMPVNRMFRDMIVPPYPLLARDRDYALPRADDVPVAEILHLHTPSPNNPLGAKGLGEAGTIGLPPAVVNAAVDALAPFGVRHLDMPLTPARIWAKIARP